MKVLSLFCICVVIVLVTRDSNAFTRNDFPEDFLFGAATSAYQVHFQALLQICFQSKKNRFCVLFLMWCWGQSSGKERLMKMEGLLAFGILSPTLVIYMLLLFFLEKYCSFKTFFYIKWQYHMYVLRAWLIIFIDIVWFFFFFADKKGNGDIACDGYHKYKVSFLLLLLYSISLWLCFLKLYCRKMLS